MFNATAKLLLNKFSASQPALQDKDSTTGAPQGLKVGDILDNLSHAAVDSTIFTVTATSGTVGAHATGLTIPAGAIITRVWTDELADVTSAGSATVAISAGATSLVAAQAYTALAGAQAQTLSAPVKLTVASAVTVTVAVATVTAGQVRVFVEYLKPVAVPYQA